MNDLKHSGYNEKDRQKILKGGLKTYSNLREKVTKGERPYFRPPSFRKKQRRREKLVNKKNGFKSEKIKYTSVMFIDSSSNDELINLMKQTEKKHMISEKDRIKFVQKNGTKIVDFLKVNDPFQGNCSKFDCLACRGKDDEVIKKFTNCRKSNVGYSIQCKLCQSRGKCKQYFGESSRNLYCRERDHFNDIKT